MGIKTKKVKKDKNGNLPLEAIRQYDAAAAQITPTYEEIQRRAYEIYLSQGAPDGQDLDHWLQAERELSQATANAVN